MLTEYMFANMIWTTQQKKNEAHVRNGEYEWVINSALADANVCHKSDGGVSMYRKTIIWPIWMYANELLQCSKTNA